MTTVTISGATDSRGLDGTGFTLSILLMSNRFVRKEEKRFPRNSK
jgi:hypothetical protein